jgi:hypothetical protein
MAVICAAMFPVFSSSREQRASAANQPETPRDFLRLGELQRSSSLLHLQDCLLAKRESLSSSALRQVCLR